MCFNCFFPVPFSPALAYAVITTSQYRKPHPELKIDSCSQMIADLSHFALFALPFKAVAIVNLIFPSFLLVWHNHQAGINAG